MAIKGVDNLKPEDAGAKKATSTKPAVKDSKPETPEGVVDITASGNEPAPAVLTTSPDVEVTSEPDADASSDDDKVELTDNSTTDDDGPQDDVPQTPVQEDEVVVEVPNDQSAS